MRPHLGKHADELDLQTIIRFMQFVFPAQLLYVVALAFIKLSLLAFYWRLFSVRSKIPIILAAVLVVAWGIAVNFALIFTCKPVEAQWDFTITDAVCLDTKRVYLGASIPNVITDIILLVLPLPYVWSLNAPITQRLILGGMFLLGVFVSVVSVVRLSILMGLNLANGDVTYNLSQVFIWSLVEVQVGLICGCLPSLRPAVQKLGLGKLFPSSRSTADAHNGPEGQSDGHIRPSAQSHSRNKSKSSGGRKNFGLFSTLAGVSQIEEEEDSYEMIKKYNAGHGKTETAIETNPSPVPSRSSADTTEQMPEMPPGAGQRGQQPIKVQRDWYVSVDHGQGRR